MGIEEEYPRGTAKYDRSNKTSPDRHRSGHPLAGDGHGQLRRGRAARDRATQTVGKLTLNGATYEGELRDGKANGKGTLSFPDDARRRHSGSGGA